MPDRLEELWQGYSAQGEPSGPVTVDQARTGALHGASHIWIWHKDGEEIRVMLQQRSAQISTWPEYYDISSAGHIDFGETPLQAAVRETSEELGVSVLPGQLHLLFVHRHNVALLDSKIIENEFQWIYGLQLDANERLDLMKSEVEGVRWLSIAAFKALATKPHEESKLVPHGPVYFAELFRAIDLVRQ